MANWVDVPFLIQEGEGRSISQNQQQLINVYPHQQLPYQFGFTEGGKKKYVLYPTPGLTLEQSISGSQGRALMDINGVVYGVYDSTFYSWTVSGGVTVLGTLNTSTGYVQMVAGQGQIGIVDGTNGYCYNTSTQTFTVVGGSFPNGAKTITFMDGYFICEVPNSISFQISNINDMTTWVATQTASAESSADNLLAVFALNEQLWLIKARSCEIWLDVGNYPFPFQRMQGAVAQYGIEAVNTICRVGQSFMWFGRTANGALQVVQPVQLQPTNESTIAIQYQIGQLTTYTDAEAFSYVQEGHEFYVLTFPTAGKTFVYDATENMWHERQSTVSNAQTRWLPRCFCFSQGLWICNLYNSANLYTINPSSGYETENNVPIVRQFTSMPLYNQYFRTSIAQLVLDTEQNLAPSNMSPTVSLSISKDGGYNFETALPVPASVNGQFYTPVVWRALGQSRVWVFRFYTNNPLPWVFLGITIDVHQDES